MSVSQRKLAERIGVSVMTVSRALRGERGIGGKTRQRILVAAQKAGLALPPSRKLAADNKLLHAVCVMAAGSPRLQDEAPFFARLNDGLRRGARECASEVMSCPETVADWPVVVSRGQVDGVALVWGDEHVPRPSAPCPVPQVYVFHGPSHADVVAVDSFGGGLQLGEHLAAMGHRRVAFVGPETRMARERLAGLRTGLEPAGAGCSPDVAHLKCRHGGHETDLLDNLLAGETRPAVFRQRFTAIACYNDWFAMHAMRRLRELGVRVPDDVSVTGFDNVMPAGYAGPKLTTCAVPVEEIGAEAVRLLYWRLEHPGAVRRTLVLQTTWVEGATVAAANGSSES